MSEGQNGADNQQWRAPDAAAPVPPPAPVDPSAPTAPPPAGYTYLPPAPVAPTAATSGAPGWTPPPRPGLIPLLPLTLGDILGGSFRVLRRNPRPTFGMALLLQGSVTLLSLVLTGYLTYWVQTRVDFSNSGNLDAIRSGGILLIVLGALAAALLSTVTGAVLQGVIVIEVSRATLGEKQTVGQLFRRFRGRIGALIGWAAIISGIVVGVIVILGALIALIVAFLGVGGVLLALLLGFLAFAAGVVLYLWLGTKLSLVPSAIVLERLRIREAVARSWSLTSFAFWRVLGIELLVAVILYFTAQIASIPLSFATPLLLGLTDPNGQAGPTAIAIGIGVGILGLALSVVVGSISAVVKAATDALIYLDLRIRTEGLDLELARFVEARQAGEELPDPFLPSAPA